MGFDLRVKLIKGMGPRKEMQDHGCLGHSADKSFSWAIVCDGIGGQKGGKLAAKTTAKCLHDYLKNELVNKEQLAGKSFLEQGIKHVRSVFAKLINKDASLQSMGCTLCMAVFFENQVYVFWSGDSRLYLFRDGKCLWDTIPHNWSFDLYRKGILSLEEARLSETSYLTGSVNAYSPEIRFDFHVLELEKMDRILVCTDGIWGLFEHPELTQEINKESIAKTGSSLSGYAKQYANDNYYGYLVEC